MVPEVAGSNPVVHPEGGSGRMPEEGVDTPERRGLPLGLAASGPGLPPLRFARKEFPPGRFPKPEERLRGQPKTLIENRGFEIR